MTDRRLALLNPNTNAETTRTMVAIVHALAPPGVSVEGHTMAQGPKVVADEAALAAAARQVERAGRELASGGAAAILVAGFGDPGVAGLRAELAIPVTGIAEAGMAEAAAHGRFSIVTTTPALRSSILGLVHAYGYADSLASLRITPGTAEEVMASEAQMRAALVALARDCAQDGAAAILIGGGPLAVAARALGNAVALPVIEPVAAGARRALALLGGR